MGACMASTASRLLALTCSRRSGEISVHVRLLSFASHLPIDPLPPVFFDASPTLALSTLLCRFARCRHRGSRHFALRGEFSRCRLCTRGGVGVPTTSLPTVRRALYLLRLVVVPGVLHTSSSSFAADLLPLVCLQVHGGVAYLPGPFYLACCFCGCSSFIAM